MNTLGPNIRVERLTGPETGWPIACHCSECHRTVITWSPYTVKPHDGDFYLLKGTCLDDDLAMQHNLYPQHDYPWNHRMGPRPEEWTPAAYDYRWNNLGVPR